MINIRRILDKFKGIYLCYCYVKTVGPCKYVEFVVETPDRIYHYPFRTNLNWENRILFDAMYKQAMSYFRSAIK